MVLQNTPIIYMHPVHVTDYVNPNWSVICIEESQVGSKCLCINKKVGITIKGRRGN
jgi:hypothetical protein